MSDDPTIAASIMESTAGANARTQDPVYHLTLSFHPNDGVPPEAMQRAVDRVLSELQLAEHQALLIAHGDRPHSHVHVMVNRVHPETLIAWDRWRDFITIDRTLRTLERRWGLQPVPELGLSVSSEGHVQRGISTELRETQAGNPNSEALARADATGRRDTAPPPDRDTLSEAAAAARAYRATVDAQLEAEDAAETANRAADQLRRWQEAANRAEQAMARFGEVLAEVYAPPQEAIREYFRRAPHLDYDNTRALFLEMPTVLGTMRLDRADPDARFATRLASRAIDAYQAVRDYHNLSRQYGLDSSLSGTAAEFHARLSKAAEISRARAAQAAAMVPSDNRQRLLDAVRNLTREDVPRLRKSLNAVDWTVIAQTIARFARPLLGRDEIER